jgi:hypothetical protein
MSDQYRHWAEALEQGRGVETEPGNPRSGFYRHGREAVAIWRHPANGDLLCSRTGRRRAPVLPDEIDDLFSYCAANPISYATFVAVSKTGQWPEDVPQSEPAPLALEPHEALAHETQALKRQFDAFLARTGPIAEKLSADICGNYAETFAAQEKLGETARQEQKAPSLAEGRRIDGLWKPAIAEANAGKRAAKKALEPWLVAERAKAAAAFAQTPDPRLSGPAAVTAGTQGRAVTLRTRQVNAIVDWSALFEYFATLNERPADLEAVSQTVVNRMVASGSTPPGVEIRLIEEAA